MNRITFLLVALTARGGLFAQITFERGYYDDVSGNRREGQIRNVGWEDNPNSIVFRESETSESKTLNASEISGFMCGDSYKFRKVKVAVDQSSSSLSVKAIG